MELSFFLWATLIVNLSLSVLNCILYGYGYYKTSKSIVNGEYKLAKRTLLFEFVLLAMVTALFAYIYSTVIFDPTHIREALYLLNITLLVFNIGFLINVILLSLISRRK